MKIISFQAVPRTISPGESTILSWVVENAATVELYGSGGEPLVGSSKAEDSVTLSPTQTTTFRLRAQSAAGHRQEMELEVEVKERTGPEVSFSVDRPRMDYETSATLSWTTSEAVRVVISDGTAEPILDSNQDPNKLSGSLDVSPAGTTVYQLTASAEDGTETTAAVELIVDPVILSFGSDQVKPYPIGAEVELEWTTSGAEDLIITSPEGQAYGVPAADRMNGKARLLVGTSGKFTLVATRGKGEATKDYEVDIGDYPRITLLAASPEAISLGADPTTITVQWEVDDAKSITLEQEPSGETIDLAGLPIDAGSIEVSLSAPTKLVFTATNDAGSDSRELVIGAVPLPTITSFESTSTWVGANESFTLSWATTGAIALELSRDGAPLSIDQDPTGSIEQTLTDGATYVLTARNLAGASVTEALEITIGAPIIDSFAVDAFRYAPGETIEFAWEVRGGTSLQILDEGGAAVCTRSGRSEIEENGCQIIAPSLSGGYEYTLELSNGVGMTATETVSLLVTDGPVITAFTAGPSPISQGEAITFSWAVLDDAAGTVPTLTIADQDGNELQVPGLVDSPNGGTSSVALDEPGEHTYTLRASTSGTLDAIATVDVEVVAAPIITSFSATPTEVAAGQPTTLGWTSQFAESATLWEIPDNGPGQLIATFNAADAQSGSRMVTPSGLEATATYRLVVKNRLDVEVLENIIVAVVKTSAITFFDVTPASVAPGGSVTVEWSTSEGAVTLSPFVDEPAVELTPAYAFSDISQTGTPIDLNNSLCRGGLDALDEGCATLTFPAGFTFPFDGLHRTEVDAYANGFLSFDVGFFAPQSGQVSNFPNATKPYVHLAPYWSDLTLDTNSAGGMFYELRSGPEGQHFVVQWKHAHDIEDFNPSDLNFQVILWPNGSFDFAFGTTTIGINPEFDAYSGVIGFQDTTGFHSHMISAKFDTFFPKGVGERTWRYFQKPQTASGTTTLTLDKTTVFTLCVDLPLGRECEHRTVVVN